MESGDEDDAFTMGEREWQKMNRDLSKQGYREGKSEGRDKGRQTSFEQATLLALKRSLKLGQVLGLIEWKLAQSQPSTSKIEREKLETLRQRVNKELENLKNLSQSQLGNLEDDSNTVLDNLVQEYLSMYPGAMSSLLGAKSLDE